MEVKVLKDEKGVMDVEIDSLTIAELMRVYLNKQGVNLAAWKREHPSKNPVLHIEDANAKKALKEAIKQVEKELDSFSDEFKKAK